MLKFILFILGTILGVFLIVKLIITPNIYKKWARYNNVRLMFLILALFAGGLVFLIYQLGSNKDISKKETLDLIQNIDIKQVERIEFFSYSKPFFSNFSKDTVVIYNESTICQLTDAIKKMSLFEYGTPIPEWQMNIKISLKSNLLDNVRIKVIKKEDGKYSAWIIKETWFGKFDLGKFSNEDLGKIIEKIHNQTNPF